MFSLCSIASLYNNVFGIVYFNFSTKTFASCIFTFSLSSSSELPICLNTLEGGIWAWLLLLNESLLLTALAVLILSTFLLDASLLPLLRKLTSSIGNLV